MSESMVIEIEVVFNASTEEVWDLITQPEMTKQYMFGCEVLSEWQKGSQIFWKGLTEDRKEIIYVKGEITSIASGKNVSFTMFDPNMGIADIPENYVSLTYELTEISAGTKLSIIQGDFYGTENSKNRFEEAKSGWEMVVPLMKKVIEK